MSEHQAEIDRIRAEYQRRAREIAPDRYSLSKPDNVLRRAGVVRAAAPLLDAAGLFPPSSADILDVGCGRGDWLLEMMLWGAAAERLSGVDLDEERVAQARRRMPAARIHHGDASALPWAPETFDLITQFTVFSSILDGSVRRSVAAEMLRVLKPGGVILWYDLRKNNPWNNNVIGLGQREVAELFPGCAVQWRTTTLAPPVARVAARISWTVAVLLESLPPLRSHGIALIRKPAEG